MKVRVPESMTLMEKLNILSDAAKYDVACTSSGTERSNTGKGVGNCVNDLPQLFRRRALYFPVEDSLYQ